MCVLLCMLILKLGKIMSKRDVLTRVGVLKPNRSIVRLRQHDNEQAIAARKVELRSPATKRALTILEVVGKRSQSGRLR